MSHRNLFLTFALVLLATHGGGARAELYVVGGDEFCTHSDIEAAFAAAEANPGPDSIRITRSKLWYDQDITATVSANLTVSGGYASCQTDFGDGLRTELRGDLSGGGTGDQEPILRITLGSGVTVNLSLLTFTKGDQDGDGRGGGIYYKGNGSTLRISDSVISSNVAGYGGGIYVELDTFTPTLHIAANTTIISNTARYSGGGINMGPYTRLLMNGAGSILAFNKALGQIGSVGIEGGYGGGIRAFGESDVNIASSGQGNLGALYGNEARYGGGVAISNDEFNDLATLRIYTTDPNSPTALKSNFASIAGGAIYAEPYKAIASPADETHVRIYDANLQDNIAPEGAAVHLTSDTDNGGTTTGADLFINNEARPVGAVACAAGVRCSVFSGNDNLDALSEPTDGATFYAGDDASIRMNRAIVEDNTGRDVIRGNSAGDGIGIAINDSLIAHNTVARNVVHTDGDSPLELHRSTITANAVGGAYVLDLSDRIELHTAIVWQPGKPVLAPGGSRDIVDVLAEEVASMSPGLRLYQGNPRFMDPDRRDYRLRAASPAVDYSNLAGTLDLDGKVRGLDLPVVANVHGTFDLGAYERQSLGNLIHNPNFAGDLHQWTAPTPPAVIYSTDNIEGLGTGSVRVSYGNIPQNPVVAMVQCVHLPGPGPYSLNAWGLAPGFTRFDRDQLLIKWQLRLAGSESCDAGAADSGGDFFVSGSGAWTRPETAGLIQVGAGQWTPTTSVLVALTVNDTGTTAPGEVQGYFDGISLTSGAPVPPGQLLVDGFEDP